jgi:hypothetical protein
MLFDYDRAQLTIANTPAKTLLNQITSKTGALLVQRFFISMLMKHIVKHLAK